MESWLQGMAITHQRPGQPASLCALRNPPVPGHRPWPRRSGLEAELGSCVGRAGAGGPDPGGLPGGRGVEPGRRGAQRQQVKRFGLSGGKKGRGWGDQGLSGEGVEPLRCQTQPPDGVSWRGWGKGPLPATMAILGPESNQIRRSPLSSPQAPSSCAEQLSGHRGRGARGDWNLTSCPHPSPHCSRVCCKRARKGFGLQAETWAPPTPCCATVTAEKGLSVFFSAHPPLG